MFNIKRTIMYRKMLFLTLLFLTQRSLSAQEVSVKLLSPLNGTTLNADYPLFSWTYLSVTNLTDYDYRFKMVEITGSQSNEVAINANPVFYEQLLDPYQQTLVYPLSAPALEDCKKYAWVIIIEKKISTTTEVGTTFKKAEVGRSTVFGFTMDGACGTTQRANNFANKTYLVPIKEEDSYIYLINRTSSQNTIRFKYNEEYSNTSIQCKILKEGTSPQEVSFSMPVNYGLNYLEYQLPGIVTVGNYYRLVIITPTGEELIAKFEIE
ncbi:MAG: hypothetical protein K1X55_00375 [Chitinophagales bacterium]|nr:hypothetical protein [Chitinophagales bacterium]